MVQGQDLCCLLPIQSNLHFLEYESVRSIRVGGRNWSTWHEISKWYGFHGNSVCLFIGCSENLYEIKLPCETVLAKGMKGKLTKLSTTSSNQLLVVTEHGYPTGFSLVIQQFSNALIFPAKSYTLSAMISEVSDVVQISSGNYIFSYRSKDTNKYQISELSADGERIIRTFSPPVVFQSWCPTYLSITEDDEIFIADDRPKEGRVLLLDSQWTEIRTIADSIDRPQRLHYLKEKQKLILGTGQSDVWTSSVLIFNLQPRINKC